MYTVIVVVVIVCSIAVEHYLYGVFCLINYFSCFITTCFTARCTIVQSMVLRLHVRPSVCLSVCNVGGSGSLRLEILDN